MATLLKKKLQYIILKLDLYKLFMLGVYCMKLYLLMQDILLRLKKKNK